MFPSEAVDENNRLQLSFLDDRNTTTGLESLSGRPVIRKCCDINEVYWVMNHTCVPKQGYATQYFDDLLSGGDDLFVRTEQFKNCDGLLQAEYFEWHSDWTIQIQINVDIEGCAYLFTSDEYCVDDFVVSLNEELPETITLVTVCPTKAKSLLPPSVYERCFNESPSVPPSNDIDLKQEQDTQAISSHETKISHLPKCCPRDYVIEDGFCRLYEHYDQKAKLQSTLLDSVKEFLINAYNKTLKLDYEFTLKCDFTRSIPLHEASQSNNSAPQLALKFRTSGQNETALHFSYYQENYWDYDSKIPHYCVDMKHSPPDNRIYEPHVFYCHLPSSVSGRYPALLYISSIGLMLTFVMYFLTPAKSKRSSAFNELFCKELFEFNLSLGVSENAAPVEDGEAKPGPKKTCYFNNMLANTIASRNFLCHISSLCLVRRYLMFVLPL